MNIRSLPAWFVALSMAVVLVGTSGCAVLDWLGKHNPPNNPPPAPRGK